MSAGVRRLRKLLSLDRPAAGRVGHDMHPVHVVDDSEARFRLMTAASVHSPGLSSTGSKTRY